LLATNAAFARLYELLTSMPGVGPVLAFTLIALPPELGKMGRKQIAAHTSWSCKNLSGWEHPLLFV
jgi:hypothetical protein